MKPMLNVAMDTDTDTTSCMGTVCLYILQIHHHQFFTEAIWPRWVGVNGLWHSF